MNEHFINVKVDREERPDVDKVYMSFVQATTGGGGWPMSVFLTPKLKPIYGGTYYPPEDQVLFRVTRNGHFGPFYSVNWHFWKLFGPFCQFHLVTLFFLKRAFCNLFFKLQNH